MRVMSWTWEDYKQTPDEILAEIAKQLREEQEERDTEDNLRDAQAG